MKKLKADEETITRIEKDFGTDEAGACPVQNLRIHTARIKQFLAVVYLDYF
jgi:hypothetical protein